MSDRIPHRTAESDRIPWVQLLAYGLGGFIPIALFNAVGQFSGLICNVGLGMSAMLVGMAMMIPRLWDAFTDPVMGYISDNTRSRWGRRIPFILGGGILVSVTFVALWWIPRDWGMAAQFLYFTFMSILFYTAVTIFEIPHGALGIEMTDDYHERTRLYSVKSFVGNLGAMATPWLYAMANWRFFKGDGDEVDGMRYVSFIVAALVLVLTFLCAYYCRERKYEQAVQQKRVSFRDNMAATLRNRSFLLLMCIVFAAVMGFNLVNGFANYITIFYLYAGDKNSASILLGVAGTVWAVSGVLAVFPLNWLSTRLNKTRTLTLAISLMGGAQISKIFCYDPGHPTLILIPTVMLSVGMLFFFTLGSSMVADICDEDELLTGKRNEGSYYSVFWWFMKLGMATAYFVAGILLTVTQFNEKQVTLVEELAKETTPLVRAIKGNLPGSEGFGSEDGKALRTRAMSFADRARLLGDELETMASSSRSPAHYHSLAATARSLGSEMNGLFAEEKSLQAVAEDLKSRTGDLETEVRGLASQTPETLIWLRILEIGIPILLCLFSLAVIPRYPLSEERVYEIKELLAARKTNESAHGTDPA